MSKHTQGEWSIEFRPNPTEGVNVAFTIIAPGGMTVCAGQSQEHLSKDYDTYIGEDECKANARLMTAAPLLLAALECAVSWADEGMTMTDQNLRDARAAIAAATGETE